MPEVGPLPSGRSGSRSKIFCMNGAGVGSLGPVAGLPVGSVPETVRAPLTICSAHCRAFGGASEAMCAARSQACAAASSCSAAVRAKELEPPKSTIMAAFWRHFAASRWRCAARSGIWSRHSTSDWATRWRSEVTGPELVASLRDFWRDQEPALRMVTATVLESLRVQALEQAYGWREQIIRATEAQRDRR
jgi:hypothetical protein